MNYLLSGYFGGGNFGDELLLDALTYLIATVDADHKIAVVYHNKVSLPYKKYTLIHPPEFNKHWLKTSFWYYINHLKSADVIIIGGGQLLQDRISWNFISGQCLLAALGKLWGKKVIFFGVGADTLRLRESKKLIKPVLDTADHIVTRDNDSRVVLKKYSKRQIMVGADLSLNYNFSESYQQHGSLILVNIRSYNLPHEKIPILASFLNRNFTKKEIVLLATETDDVVLNKLKKLLDSSKFKAISIFKSNNKRAYFKLLKNAELVISMRFHFILLAAYFGKKVISLSYDQKVTSLCNELSMPYIETENISLPGLQRAYEVVRNEPRSNAKKRSMSLSQKGSYNKELFIRCIQSEKRKTLFKEIFSLILFLLRFRMFLFRDLIKKVL